MADSNAYPVWSNKPLSLLYEVYSGIGLIVKLPIIAVTAAVPGLRPLPQWTFKQVLMSRILRGAFHKLAVIGVTETHTLKAGKEGDRFQVIEPFQAELYTGPLAAVADIKPITVGGTWFPKKVEKKAEGLKTIVLHIHGGAFIWGDGRTECAGFAAGIMRENAGADAVFSPQYRLSAWKRTNPFPAALQDALTAYLYLTRTLEIEPSRIVVAGDSCGATIATALVRYLEEFGKELKLGLPGAAVLASPMIAPLKTHGPTSPYTSHPNYETDFVPPSTLSWGWQVYAGIPIEEAVKNPYFSPLGHPFATSVPLFVSVGARELFLPENEDWVAEMKAVPGNNVEFNYEKDALHDTFLLGSVLGFEESAKSVATEAGKFIEKNRLS
jgi:acetyl esterase/lipase